MIGTTSTSGHAKADIFYNWSALVPINSAGFLTGSGQLSTAAPISGATQVLTFTNLEQIRFILAHTLSR